MEPKSAHVTVRYRSGRIRYFANVKSAVHSATIDPTDPGTIIALVGDPPVQPPPMPPRPSRARVSEANPRQHRSADQPQEKPSIRFWSPMRQRFVTSTKLVFKSTN